MSKFDKKYDAFQIFEEMLDREKDPPEEKTEKKPGTDPKENMFYEIEYDSSPFPGVGRYVLKSQKIEEPPRDPIRELFEKMREIARRNRSYSCHNSRFHDKRVRIEDAKIFYEQGMFMQDFEDDYEIMVPYTSYFPYYQMMGHEQLRTYFSWRTKVRRGEIEPTSLSYAFLYIYELLGNIGAANPREGLEKLLFFWRAYRVYEKGLDKYVPRWMKDYHIYYELPWTFQEFVEQNDLSSFFPGFGDKPDEFQLLCTVSKYDIRKSAFFTEETEKLIRDCFAFTIRHLRELFRENEMDFDEAIFQPTKNMVLWTPFKDALFYPWLVQEDRRVVLSEKEIYRCSQNRWSSNSALTTESGKQLMGYIMKQMESSLRKEVKYKHGITAKLGSTVHISVARLEMRGISLEKEIIKAVQAFYREATRTVVNVDLDSLEKIRREALLTQEKLIVPEEEEAICAAAAVKSECVKMECVEAVTVEPEASEDPWDMLREALSETQMTALTLAFHGGEGLQGFAREQGIMLEVLMEGINELAMDLVGDSLMDEEFVIYEDYREEVKGMVERV